MAYTLQGLGYMLASAINRKEDKVNIELLKDAISLVDKERTENMELIDLLYSTVEKDGFKKIESKIMVYIQGTPAIHKLGNIQRDYEGIIEYFRVYEESPNYYKGNFVEGFGFIDVIVPKSGIREMTDEESDREKNMKLVIV